MMKIKINWIKLGCFACIVWWIAVLAQLIAMGSLSFLMQIFLVLIVILYFVIFFYYGTTEVKEGDIKPAEEFILGEVRLAIMSKEKFEFYMTQANCVVPESHRKSIQELARIRRIAIRKQLELPEE